jgi:NAD(P)-dependent dehydrogenase (short-subunit alcohol dehydrogenase family)
MTRPLTLLTGASRGLGLALAEALLARGHEVIAIARRPTEIAAAAHGPGRLESWSLDLAQPLQAAARLSAWLNERGAAGCTAVTLINNAGVVSRLAPLSESTAEDLSNALRVGLEAPLLLSAAFLRATAGWGVPRKLLLISSGLGRRGMAGSGAYCAAKAGLDNLARALALEEAGTPDGARVVSLAPGIIDTDMQVQLRAADPALFPEHDRFVGFKTGGQLDSPAQAAAKVLKFMDRDDFGSQPVADVRDA